jgi:proteic killer suppression protein
MILSFLNGDLQSAWENGKEFANERLPAKTIFRLLDTLNASESPTDVAFFGRFYEWQEGGLSRYGVQITEHWTLTYGWLDGHATDIDLEWHN